MDAQFMFSEKGEKFLVVKKFSIFSSTHGKMWKSSLLVREQGLFRQSLYK
jgi:hypothetical protein